MSDALVIGGTGLLGYHTTLELISRGHAVTSLALPPLPAPDLFPEGVTSLFGNLSDMEDAEVLDLMRGKHAVFFAIGADERVTPPIPSGSFFYEANVLPTQRAARLAREAGVAKFVVYGSYTAEFADVWPDLNYRSYNGYPRTRLLQEEVAIMEAGADMDVMVLRLPYIFGTMPGRMPLWTSFIDAVRAQPTMVASPRGATSAVTVEQVARAAVGAMEHGTHEGRYPINGYDLTYAEFNRIICEELGRDPGEVVEVPVEALLPTMQGIDTQEAAAGREHGVHMVDTAHFQDRRAVSDPAPTQAVLHYGEDDVPAAVRRTIQFCLAHEGSRA